MSPFDPPKSLLGKDPLDLAGDRPRIAYKEVLNPAQLEAVTFGKGPLLVIAGAGSGKTRTLVYRVARLVEQGVLPRSILLLSFTRKASQEMLVRACQLLDQRCQEVAGGTFHSFANGVLRRYAPKFGFDKGFSIIDRGDSEDLIALIRKDFSSKDDVRYLPRKSTLASIFSRAVNKSASLEDIIYEEYPHFAAQREQIHNIWILYGQHKKEHAFLDYDDLLVYFQRLLSEHPEIRSRLTTQYEYILVDEYQDTNLIQAQIISLLAGPESNIMVVGDDAQSIYAFRGANYKNILSFPENFSGTRVVKLEENYRSVQPILSLANALIAPASAKYSKCLFTKRGGGRLPLLVSAVGENAQSRYIVKEIAALRRQGKPLDQIAVLFRASFHTFDLELELNRASFPFIKVGGFKFTESAHIKDILAHLKIFSSPNDRLSWHRVLLLVDKIGPQSAQRIFEAIAKQGTGAIALLSVPLKQKKNPALEHLKEFVAGMSAGSLSIAQGGEMALKYYLSILRTQFDDHPRRLKDIEQLITIMERYENWDDFFADMALEPPTTSIDNRMTTVARQTDCLTLSTIHSAKGLEWDTVFILWALDGRFPSQQAINQPESLEEERRLMYVAVTRARQNLHLVCPVQIYDRATQSMLYEPSRFLEGISEEILERRYFNP